jgi:hypothetical protein
MAETPQSKTTFPPSHLDEKTGHFQQEVLTQDETPDSIEAKKKEDALRRKLDRFVAPVMMLLMLISYLDRGNIGFAATQGMTTDIGLKGNQLNVSYATCFCKENHMLMDIDGSISLLHLLYPSRIPYFYPREATPIQQSDSSHHILLGSGMSLHRIRAKLCWTGYNTHLPRFLRRLLIPFHDTIPVQLVHARRAWYPSRVPVHCQRAERRLRWSYRVWDPVHGWSRWVVWLALVRTHTTDSSPPV